MTAAHTDIDLPEPERPGWRARLGQRVKRRMKRRVLILFVYIVLLQLPGVADWRRDMSGQVGPTFEQLAVDLRTLTLIARAEKARQDQGLPAMRFAPRPEPKPEACEPVQAVERGQTGSILFHRNGRC